MPWCDECDRFWSPNTLKVDGSCPVCGRVVAEQSGNAGSAKAPWHFKLLVAAMSLYLGWRAIQAVMWVADKVLT